MQQHRAWTPPRLKEITQGPNYDTFQKYHGRQHVHVAHGQERQPSQIREKLTIGVTDKLDMPPILIGSGEKNNEAQIIKMYTNTKIFNVQQPLIKIYNPIFLEIIANFTFYTIQTLMQIELNEIKTFILH
jgi:hypothetical protein